MTVVTDDLDVARAELAKTDDLTSLEVVLKEIEVSVDESDKGPVATFDLEGDAVPLTENALKTLAVALNIPQNYLLKCPARLQADNLNYWQGRLSERKRVRTVIGDDKVQALTSPKFLPIKNVPIFEALVEKLSKGDPSKLHLDVFEHDWLVTRMALCHADASHKVQNGHFMDRNPEVHVGDVVRAGVNVMNSLTQHQHTEVRPFAFRLFCANRMVTPLVGGEGDSFRYDSKSDPSPLDWLGEMIDQVGSQLEPLFANLDNAAQRQLPDPQMALEAQLTHVPGPLREAVVAAYQEEPDPTMWGVVNALTRAANDDAIEPRFRFRTQTHAGHLAFDSRCDECGRPLDSKHA